MNDERSIHGVLGEFRSADDLLHAVRQAREDGYVHMEAFSPLPVHGLGQALGLRQRALPFLVLAGGLLGAIGGFSLQYYASVIAYPMNVGGRPDNSWPAFIPVTFEMTILGAALAAVLGMLFLNGLPQPYHPVFHVPEFKRASQDRFFLLLASRDPRFENERAKRLLDDARALTVKEVER